MKPLLRFIAGDDMWLAMAALITLAVTRMAPHTPGIWFALPVAVTLAIAASAVRHAHKGKPKST